MGLNWADFQLMSVQRLGCEIVSGFTGFVMHCRLQ